MPEGTEMQLDTDAPVRATNESPPVEAQPPHGAPPPPFPQICPGDAMEIGRLFTGLLLDLRGSPLPLQSSFLRDLLHLAHDVVSVFAVLEDDKRFDYLAGEIAKRSRTFLGGMTKEEVKSALRRLIKAIPKDVKDWLHEQWACRISGH